MADSKKYNGSTWEHSLKKFGTGTEIITTFPTTIYADGSSATAALQGNMQQTGTPTPSNPIQPSECGALETSGTKAGQYKLPISSASTTTPVYLGEVQTTRKIKKLVLTGEETGWQMRSGEPSNEFFCSKANLGISALGGYGVCNVYQYTISSSFSELNDKEFIITTTNVGFRDLWVSTAGAWIYFLQQQYANGTPVTVWYVLATEETGIVNEPIRKIGDYADTVSGITIPTITGTDSFDVETTLKPSEVELTYTGWHDAGVKESNGSE